MSLAVAAAAAAVPGAIPAPSIEYSQLAPMLVVFGAAIVGVLVEAFVPRELRRPIHLLVTFGALVAAFVWTCVIAASSTLFVKGSAGHVAAMGAVAVDRPTLFIQGTILVLAAVSVLLIADASHDVSSFAGRAAAVPGSSEERVGLLAGLVHTEIYPLTLFSVGGMLLFPASNDLLTMFIALETLSLPLYLLCGLARRRRLLSHEAAMKYFLLGSFSSAFFLFGIALLYGYSGSVSLASIAAQASSGIGSDTLLFGGIALAGLGLLFKVGAVPFHSWKPDVYQGAPTPITAVIASSEQGLSSSLFYLAVYGLSTVGAFAVITLVRDSGGEADHLSRWAGLGKRSPVVAGVFALFLLTFAGIPLTSGFAGKFAVFSAAIAGHLDRGAVPDRRVPGVAQGHSPDQGVRRRTEGRARAGRNLPGRRSRDVVASRPRTVHQRVPGPDRNVHALPRIRCLRVDGAGAVHDLHPVDVPADDDRPGQGRQRAGT